MKTSILAIHTRSLFQLGAGLMMLVGCGQSYETSSPVSTPPPTTAEVHDHPSEGPHHGELVELGNEEYHLEIVHDDDAGTVTAYILDSSARVAVPIDATEILVNLSHDGEAEQFALAADPQSSDPEGKSSRFTSTEAELAADLDNETVAAQLVVTINGKQYRGAIEHDHESHEPDKSHKGKTHKDHDG